MTHSCTAQIMYSLADRSKTISSVKVVRTAVLIKSSVKTNELNQQILELELKAIKSGGRLASWPLFLQNGAVELKS